MAKILDKQRYRCALGAMQTVQAIDRAVPILHSGPGCAAKLCNIRGSSGYFSPNIFPCTSINEKDVVFGGNGKLRTTIENALKVIDADLYVVLTGCIPEIVGDSSEEIAGEFRDAEKPVLYASTAGFRGSNYIGHEQVIDAITDWLTDRQSSEDHAAQKKEAGQVNIWADVPYQDELWSEDYRQIAALLEALGLKPNVIFGYGNGIRQVERIPKAELNLLLSPWVGIRNMEKMEKQLGIPWMYYPTLPMGAFETSRFLRAVGERMSVPEERTERLITEKEKYYYWYIERFADLFLETRVMAKQFTVVSDALNTLALTKFLVNDLGLFPAKQFIVDDTPKEFRERILEEFGKLNHGIRAEVAFETDGYKIHSEIRKHDYHGYPLIIGSHWEKALSDELKGHYLNVTWPVNERVVISKSYVGYDGGLRLIEDIYSEAVKRFN